MAFQRASWRVERGGWLVVGLLVILALLGVFANGPLSSGVAQDPASQLEVQYDRFGRSGATTRMVLELPARPAGETVLRIGAPFMETFSIQGIHPRPVREYAGPDGAEMAFRSTGGAGIRVYLDLRPERSGLAESEISIVGARPARLTQFIFP